MRSWFTLAALMLAPLPSLAGPQDPWTVDPKASALSFSVAQVGSIVSGRFPAWTGEIVLDPSSLASARIDIKIDTRPVSTNNRDVPQSANPEGCAPMPNDCPAQMICSVSTVGDERVCGGVACCQAFCEANGCGTCCATPSQ